MQIVGFPMRRLILYYGMKVELNEINCMLSGFQIATPGPLYNMVHNTILDITRIMAETKCSF